MNEKNGTMSQINQGEIEAVGTRPMSELAYELISSKIIRLELPPGTALIEKTLMEELEFGRTPVREALQRLTIEGLICRTHYRGVYVCEVTEKSIAQVSEFRMLLDPAIARQAVESATERNIAELNDNLEQLRNYLSAKRYEVYIRASRRFYLTLARVSGNLHLEQAATHIYNFDARLFYLAAVKDSNEDRLTRSRLENAAGIMDCMRRRSPDEAEAAVQLHLVRYFEEISRLMEDYSVEESGVLLNMAGSRWGY